MSAAADPAIIAELYEKARTCEESCKKLKSDLRAERTARKNAQNSLLTIVVSLAWSAHRLIPPKYKDGKFTAHSKPIENIAKVIEDEALDLCLDITDETVLKWLKEAARNLSPEADERFDEKAQEANLR